MPNDNINGALTPRVTINGVLRERQRINGNMREGGGTSNYEELENLPAFNNIVIEGDHDPHYYGIAKLSDIPQAVDYSTNEVNTGVKWIDGKDIYQKTIDIGSIQNYNAGWHSIEPHGNYYETLINATATGGDFQICVCVACNDPTYLEIYVPTNSYFRYITIQYTKVS